jgi:quercetin 2,3-dioxygenase
MAIRVVLGEISAKDVTTRAAIPSGNLPRWPPFERVAETIATPRRRFPPHRHEGVEVLTYVIEGSGSHEFATQPPTAVRVGAAQLLTAPTAVAHSLNPGAGQSIRWIAVMTTLPPGVVGGSRVQTSQTEPSGVQPDGTVVRRLVGPGSRMASAMGLEAEEIEFQTSGAAFRKVGHDRMAVTYVLSGTGRVDSEALDAGEAALVDDAAGVALQGPAGFHVMFVTAPRVR